MPGFSLVVSTNASIRVASFGILIVSLTFTHFGWIDDPVPEFDEEVFGVFLQAPSDGRSTKPPERTVAKEIPLVFAQQADGRLDGIYRSARSGKPYGGNISDLETARAELSEFEQWLNRVEKRLK